MSNVRANVARSERSFRSSLVDPITIAEEASRREETMDNVNWVMVICGICSFRVKNVQRHMVFVGGHKSCWFLLDMLRRLWRYAASQQVCVSLKLRYVKLCKIYVMKKRETFFYFLLKINKLWGVGPEHSTIDVGSRVFTFNAHICMRKNSLRLYGFTLGQKQVKHEIYFKNFEA